MPIHPTAIVDKSAEIDPSAEIGAYAVVEGAVRIGPGTRLFPHAYVSTGTTLGARCEIHPFAVVGHPPQDLKYTGAPSYTVVGDETIVREGASIHRGTVPESTTVVGRRVYIMGTGHIGHNCVVGDDVKLTHGSMLGGHAIIGPGAFVGGNAAVHQFVRIGELVMLAGQMRFTTDVPPFMLAEFDGVVGPNVVGLRRARYSAAERLEIRNCHRILYRSGLHFPRAIEQVVALVQTAPGRRLAEFLQAPSKRGYARLRRRAGDESAPLEEDSCTS